MTMWMRALILLPACLVAVCAFAASNDRQQPVNLRADRIDIDQKKGTSLYRGHVLLTQGTLRLGASRAEARNRGNRVEIVTAEGSPVTFRHRPEGGVEFIEGQASRVHYRVPDRQVDLYGNVRLQRGRDSFRADVAHYDIENRKLLAEGNAQQRAYVALVPRARLPVTPAEGKP